MKPFRILLILVLAAIVLLPIMMHSSRKAHNAKNNSINQVVAPPNAPLYAPKVSETILDTITSDTSMSKSSVPATANSSLSTGTNLQKSVQPNLVALIVPAILGLIAIFLIVRSFTKRKSKKYTVSTTTHTTKPTPSATRETPVVAAFRGGMSEPYCSEACYNQAGNYISAVMLKSQSGVCGFCQKPVQASMYGEATCSVIPYEGVSLFVCKNCAAKATTYLRLYKKCCMCQKDLTIPAASTTTVKQAEKKSGSGELIQRIISEKHLRPLGNKKRVEPFGKSINYNVRMFLFDSRENAQKYYQLISRYVENNPPQVFLEMILLYMANSIFPQKYAVVLPSEYQDDLGNYKTWLRNCTLTCNDTLRLQQSTDHSYAELHKYVGCVYSWTILAPKEFVTAPDNFSEILSDDESNAYPALKMVWEDGTTTPPEKPNPTGEWIGVVFNIGQFEEALYGKASIKLLQQIVGKDGLANTLVHGGDLLPNAVNWCLALKTNNAEQLNTIKQSVSATDDRHLLANGNRIISMSGPSNYNLPYQGFFSDRGDFIG